jgi:hypothetical protein
MVQMLIDEAKQEFPLSQGELEIVRVINEAQMFKIREYVLKNEERALRPLYRFRQGLLDSDIVNTNAGEKLLFTRGVRLYSSDDVPIDEGITAAYLQNNMYMNFLAINGFAAGGRFPRQAYFTVQAVTAANEEYPIIRFNDLTGTTHADVWFICEPLRFSWDVTTKLGTPLQIASEYHIEVCTLAAEMINDLDIGENERSQPQFQNEQIQLDKVGNIGG